MNGLKGLILSGGAGTRLRPITHTSAKQLVPVANKPVLFYAIEAIVSAGIDDIGIVISPETGDEVRDAVGDGSRFGARITYVPQAEPLGLAHALLTAESFLGESPFVMYLGDNLLRHGITDLVEAFRASRPDALILLTAVPNPEAFGVAELDGAQVIRLTEKPQTPPSDLALVGVYMFGPGVFDAARAIVPSARGELEITDAIQRLIAEGGRVEHQIVRGWWKDTGGREDMLEANRLVLEDLETRIDGELVDSKVEGCVILEQGAVVEHSVLRGPVLIGANSRISDACIGPYTSIGDDVVIASAEIEHSIVLSGCRIEGVDSRIEASLFGRNVRVGKSDDAAPRAVRFLVGDNSEIAIP
jgi:glucose-1-phosphate thymidylyltransferase